MGGVLKLPYIWINNWPNDLILLKKYGFQIIALTPSLNAISLSIFLKNNKNNKIALLVGNEGDGLSKESIEISGN